MEKILLGCGVYDMKMGPEHKLRKVMVVPQPIGMSGMEHPAVFCIHITGINNTRDMIKNNINILFPFKDDKKAILMCWECSVGLQALIILIVDSLLL